eukprot:CAMPEP_0182430786 /NCGR_PEP_ID=MMETSP1167-20130531/43329_1 /TAXON_ID=2988 /ORGANISM="Mallomonas Sp, Strain CCMP3275" /LENGTH=771 /DNA_ID=CAMNT_0024616265 /DNA_START=401 /DNA_END=2713 /DNA_ORIENTATION=+
MTWTRHDGNSFGIQKLTDTSYNLEVTGSFIMPDKDDTKMEDSLEKVPTWVQRFNLTNLRPLKKSDSQGVSATDHSLLFYFGLDCDGNRPTDRCIIPSKIKSLRIIERDNWEPGMAASLVLVGHSVHSGWFHVEVNMFSEDSTDLSIRPTLSYWLAGRNTVSEAITRLQNPPVVRGNRVQSTEPLFTEDGDLANKIELNVGVAMFQARAVSPLVLEVALYEHLNVSNELQAISMAKKGVFTTDPLDVSRWMLDKENKFDEKFNNIFKLHSKRKLKSSDLFSDDDCEAGKHALSAVLGGIGFFHGTPDVGDAMEFQNDSDDSGVPIGPQSSTMSKVVREPISLLCTTPSRTAFPRGFLWDEGFHQLLVSAWEPRLSIEILSSWMSGMYMCGSDGRRKPKQTWSRKKTSEETQACCGGGWIPREMILGEEARGRVPKEFITQRVNIANPPTLLLALESLLMRAKLHDINPCSSSNVETCTVLTSDQEEILDFLHGTAPALHMWIQWFLFSQRGPSDVPGSFRWRGRSAADGKLLPNTLASGLDDYPRSAIPSPLEHHVDLLCWMVKASQIMSTVQSILSIHRSSGRNSLDQGLWTTDYAALAVSLAGKVDELHWSEKYNSYMDVGLHSETGSLQTDVLIRCTRGNSGSTVDVAIPMSVLQTKQIPSDYCPPDHPNPMYPLSDGRGGLMTRQRFVSDEDSISLQHVPRVGYVNIFPLLLGVLSPSSPRLDAVLNQIEDPSLLWTPYGLRSLATTDRYYRKNNAAGDAPYWRGPIW